MTGDPTPTRTSSAPSPPGQGERTLARLGLSAPEAGVAVVAIGLSLFWLVYTAIGYASGLQGGREGGPGVDPWGFDLSAYLNAGKRLVDEGSLYAQDLIAAPFAPGSADLFYYAPPMGVGMVPLTSIGFEEAAWIWWVFRVAALGLACFLMPVRSIIRALGFATVAFSLPALTDSIVGNVSLLLLLPLVVGWRWLDRPIGSIGLAVAASIRPALGVFLLWQLLRRQWRAAAWLVAGGIGLVLLTLPVVGVSGYQDYLAVLVNLRPPAAADGSLDLGSAAMTLGASDLVGVAQVVSVALAMAAILIGLRRDREASYMVTLCASLLLVPLLWDHYLVTLMLPAALLAHRVHVGFVFVPLLSWLPFLSTVLVVAFVVLSLVMPRDVSPSRHGRALRPAGGSAGV